MTAATERDEFLQALDALEGVLPELIATLDRMRVRIEELRQAHSAGGALREIVSSEDPPLLVQLLTQSANLLQSYGTRVRRSEALALYREGLTMEEIAAVFGVTRQRISALLRTAQ